MNIDVKNAIDTLVAMSGSKQNVVAAQMELKEIEERAQEVTKRLDELRLSMNNEKYFKASDKIIDENIKVSLESKIKTLKNELASLISELDELLEKEEELHKEQGKLQEELKRTKKYLSTMEEAHDSSYQSYINEASKRIDILVTRLKEVTKSYKEVQVAIMEKTGSKEDFSKKIAKEEKKLYETKENLQNNGNYLDREAQKEDLLKVQAYEEELEGLTKRKAEILTDANMIAEDAKRFLEEGDVESAFAKIHELVVIVNQIPFMSLRNDSNLKSTLEAKLEEMIHKRDSFLTQMNTTTVSTLPKTVTTRKEYLQKRIDALSNEISTYESQVKTYQEQDATFLFQVLLDAENNQELLEKEVESYKEFLTNESLSLQKKSLLQASLEKKEHELIQILGFINCYQQEMQEIMLEVTRINEQVIPQLREKVSNYTLEIQGLDKNSYESSYEDVLKAEKNKEALEEFNKTIDAIRRREEFGDSPDEIYASLTFDAKETRPSEIKEEIDSVPVLNFDYDALEAKQNEEVSSNALDEFPSFEPNPRLEDFTCLPLEDFSKPSKEKYKVIQIEDVPTTNEPDLVIHNPVIEETPEVLSSIETTSSEDENPFLIGDYLDSDYIDFQKMIQDEVN